MTFSIWARANASRMSAALAYFAMLSLAPCLMIAIAIAGYIYDDGVAATEIVKQVERVTTPEIAQTVDGLIQRASKPRSGILAGTISLCVLVFAASSVFTQLTDTFDDIWGVTYHGFEGFLATIRKRLIGIGMVLIVGVLLIAILLMESTMAYIRTLVDGYPSVLGWLMLADKSLSYFLMPLVLSLMFWFFPSTTVKWGDAWPAGILTACLIASSRFLIAIYMEFSTTSEVYGAMGSLAVLLIWIYMTGLVVFFGASFSHAWAETFGSRSTFGNLEKDAEPVESIGDSESEPLTLERRPSTTP